MMATLRGDVVLSDEFALYPKKSNLHSVSLTRSGIFYSVISNNGRPKELKDVNLSDVIGCRCQRSPGCQSAFITIFSYPFKKKVLSSKSARRRVVIVFEVNKFASFDENLQLATKWRNVINCFARNIPINLEDLDRCKPPSPGKLLILINPHSGPGKALQIFNNDVKPMLTEAEIPYKTLVTEHAGHARELVQTLDLGEWYAIVIVSGDGLIFEVLNGLMERRDWEQAVRIPIGCLPGGSGNALCCSINYSAGEPVRQDPVLHSTFVLIKHQVLPMDLVLLQTPTQQIFSFLSVNWGLMADIDYESEKYRSIGEARFTLGAIKRILSLRSYRGRVSFLPVAEYDSKVVTKIRRFSLESRSPSKSTLSLESNEKTSPLGSQDTLDSNPDLHSAENTRSTDGKSQHQSSMGFDGSDFDKNFVGGDNHPQITTDSIKHNGETVMVNGAATSGGGSLKWKSGKITAAGSQGDIEIQTETASAKRSENHAIATPLLTPLNQPVPEDWVVIEDNFVSVSALYQTHLGSDVLSAPHAHLSDGIMYLMLVREGIPKNALLSIFMTIEEGGHLDSPYVEMHQILAFRFEPESSNGTIMVDGERIDVTPIQGQVLPKLSRIMAIR